MHLNQRQLIDQLHDQTIEFLEPLTRRLLEHVEESLFTRAERAPNNQVQAGYFDDLRDLRFHRDQVAADFLRRISDNFGRFSRRERLPESEPLSGSAPLGLSLVDDHSLNQNIATSRMVQRVHGQCFQSLYALHQRLSVLNQGHKIEETEILIGPEQLVQAFRGSLEVLNVSEEAQLLTLDAFGSEVLAACAALYDGCNRLLIEADVLPNLRFDVRRVHGSSGSSQRPYEEPSATEPRGSSDTLLTAQPAPGGDRVGELGDLQSLLGPASERGWAPSLVASPKPSAGSSAAPGPTYSAHQLADVVTEVQQQTHTGGAGSSLNQRQTVDEVKQLLLAQIEKLNQLDGQDAHVSSLDADIIDLVGMLFEYMLNDAELSDSVKALLSHLHTPFLKVALLDKEFFTRSSHPARQLLNALAKAGARWVVDQDLERGIFPKMRAIVDRILLEFNLNIALFEELLTDFNAHVDKLEKRADLAEKRAVETIKGQEKLRSARNRATQEVNDRLDPVSLPECAVRFLEQSWTDILVFTLLRKGEESQAWRETVQVIDDLIWTLTPKATEEERAQVRLRLPEINESIQNGFTLLGGYQGDSKQLLRELANAQREALETQTEPAAAEAQAASPGNARQSIRASDAAASSNFSPELQAAIADLRKVPFGTWFEFTINAQGDTMRGKLSWFSPLTSRYMFVDQNGKQVGVRSLVSLANSILNGDARILSGPNRKPFMDRATDAIMDLLKRRPAETVHAH
ncbi:MAG: DUF1631 domain-containing protein [Pseudomonadota bacterium]|nr:DUF1631 domain-containing protein [Pseudomonadota bacterium]